MYDDEDEPQIYFIGTKHPEFVDFPFEKGSVVLNYGVIFQKEMI